MPPSPIPAVTEYGPGVIPGRKDVANRAHPVGQLLPCGYTKRRNKAYEVCFWVRLLWVLKRAQGERKEPETEQNHVRFRRHYSKDD